MLCEKCQKNLATVHMQKIINGEKSEYHLCEVCANKSDTQIYFDNFFQGFLDSMINSGYEGNYSGKISEKKLRCARCSMSYDDFRKRGKFACPECYNTFKEEMNIVLKNIHGSNEHQGKFPKKSGAGLKIKHETEKLRLLLVKAIENEEYEEAARLRDTIRELERMI